MKGTKYMLEDLLRRIKTYPSLWVTDIFILLFSIEMEWLVQTYFVRCLMKPCANYCSHKPVGEPRMDFVSSCKSFSPTVTSKFNSSHITQKALSLMLKAETMSLVPYYSHFWSNRELNFCPSCLRTPWNLLTFSSN